MNTFEDFIKFMNEMMVDVKASKPTNEGVSVETPKPTKARDLLNYLIEKSYDCGDVFVIPKRIIEGVKDNIID